jgi:RimJ/RimL family protein N-acetyltransferase
VSIRLEPWGEDDLPLLEKLMGDPVLTENLCGPESPETIVERQKRYERLPGTGKGRMFKIVEAATGESVGSVGYWERASEGQVYETGWMVLPAFQGRGVATSATSQVIERAKAERKHRFLYAYPSVDSRVQARPRRPARRRRLAPLALGARSTRRRRGRRSSHYAHHREHETQLKRPPSNPVRLIARWWLGPGVWVDWTGGSELTVSVGVRATRGRGGWASAACA